MNTFNKYDFTGKVALVTGAGSGMGLTTAKAFAESGATVVLAGRHHDALQIVVDELKASGYQALAIGCDVTDEAQVKALIDQTVAAFGRLDVAFNNAGVISQHVDTVDLPNEEWDRVMAINLRGVWTCMKYELAQMLKQGSGAIVNNSSIGGLNGVPGLPAYIASKHGVLGLTKAAALENATKGIRVNAICPGMIDTPMGDVLTGGNQQQLTEMAKDAPMERFGTTTEIADAVLWLCSPGAGYVIGQALTVDGGYSAR